MSQTIQLAVYQGNIVLACLPGYEEEARTQSKGLFSKGGVLLTVKEWPVNHSLGFPSINQEDVLKVEALDKASTPIDVKSFVKGGISRIVDERIDQILTHGYTPEGDRDKYIPGQLSNYAAFLIHHNHAMGHVPDWVVALFHKHINDPIKRLAIAGALIAADIDQHLAIQRQEAKKPLG